MSTPIYLVTGAAGKTGAYVVQQLLEKGHVVRAFVRKHDERSNRLAELGATIALGDFYDIASIRKAMTDVRRVYFCYPPQGDRLVEATTIIAAAARDAGVEALVNMSQLPVREDAPSLLSRNHWQSENILDWADIGAIHIRPGYFAENLLMFGAATIATEGKLYLPYGDNRHAPVASSDIARVVVALLTQPALHTGQRYILTGPKSLTIAQMAEVLSNELGRSIEYVNLPLDDWGSILGDRMGQPQFLVNHLKAVAIEHQEGVFNKVTDLVERLTGQPPQSLEDFIIEHRALLQPESVAA
ncbi:MAG: NmrA family NAD(P)-binding protein [Planctomycetota bacterium]|nr:NmrA family NAD(P)-binding protein [Planctomycetota bacterium]